MNGERDLVVLSHLRWVFVWQRPQHLISRLAGSAGRTWFVEEPVATGVDTPRLCHEQHGAVTRVWYEVPGDAWHTGFDDPLAAGYGGELLELVGRRSQRTTWLYTPMALPLVQALGGDLLIYDVMDDLASFAHAAPVQRLRRQQALHAADLVFAGGRSLHAAVADAAPGRAFLFASGVDPEHYAAARQSRRRASGQPPVAGYVGVVDERLDLELVERTAYQLPDWEIRLVGPVVKIDPATLPQAANLRYLGMAPYERLPEVIAGFDVALMPFAISQATRSLSPTKTLEYLAAGLPVVSTPIPDVVSDFADVVDLREDAVGFAAACRAVRDDCLRQRDAKLRPLLALHRWDAIAARMARLMEQAVTAEPLAEPVKAAPAQAAGDVA